MRTGAVTPFAAAATAVVAFALGGCSSPSEGPAGTISVVASTNVYGEIATQLAGRLAGNRVRISSIISDPAIDPHEYEATPRDQLAVARADLVIENGGGYDDFVAQLRDAAGGDAEVLDAVDVSGKPQGDSFNEHVWYDFPTVAKVADRIARFLVTHDRAHAAVFESNARAFRRGLDALTADAARLKASFGGDPVAITEPLPMYLLTACGLANRTPSEFTRAVEDGTDVPPRVLQDTLALFREHRVGLLVYNDQTAGPQTDAIRAAAQQNGIPAVPVSETLPAGTTYLGWMRSTLREIGAAESGALN